MRIRGWAACAAVVSLCAAGQVSAAAATQAQLSAVKGEVLVNQDGRLVPASGAGGLRAGDRAVAVDGQATITYADGCVVALQPKASAVIGERSPCAQEAKLVGASQPAQMFGLDGFWGAFAIFAVGAVVIAVVASDDDDDIDLPVSP